MHSVNRVNAIIWDYDGTLVDTRRKNLNVTRKIIRDVAGISPEEFSILDSIEAYVLANKRTANWRELYLEEFGFSEALTDKAGKLWTEYQLNDSTPTPLLDGIEDICSYFSSIPQGIVSQNARSNILNSLQSNGLAGYFRHVVGYEEVPLIKQKPEPNGLILCLKKLTEMKSGITFYIGDHQTDTHCAVKANQILQKDYPGISILSIGAFYSTHADDTGWQIKPDFTAFYPEDIVKIIGSYQEQV